MGGMAKYNSFMESPLLPETASDTYRSHTGRRYDISDVLVAISLAYLTYETASAVWRFRWNKAMIVYIIGMYLSNMALLWIWRKLDTTPKTDEARRCRLKKMGCLVIVTILTNLSYPIVAHLIPANLRLVFFAIGGGLVLCSLCLCFWYCLHEEAATLSAPEIIIV